LIGWIISTFLANSGKSPFSARNKVFLCSSITVKSSTFSSLLRAENVFAKASCPRLLSTTKCLTELSTSILLPLPVIKIDVVLEG
jgi:hypothetical protein